MDVCRNLPCGNTMEFGFGVLIVQVDIEPSVWEAKYCLPSKCVEIDVIG